MGELQRLINLIKNYEGYAHPKCALDHIIAEARRIEKENVMR